MSSIRDWRTEVLLIRQAAKLSLNRQLMIQSENNETVVVNDAFWRVHGNKCISMKLNQEVVSGLLSATETEVKKKGINDESIDNLNESDA